MANSYFRFKQFVVYQDRCSMKVGTDGVLLGAWTDVESVHSILDIGAGTGLISLMLAQRSEACVTAIEVDEESASQAQENVDASPWKERIALRCCRVQDFVSEQRFDCIVSNPPYFNRSLKSPKEGRTLARHTDSLSYEDLLRSVDRLLTEKGRFSVILPYSEKEMFLRLAEEQRLYCVRLTEVLPTPASQPKRFMAEFGRIERSKEIYQLVIEEGERHHYSEAYRELTQEFYL